MLDELRGLVVALNAHMTGLRRHVDDCDEERIHDGLALAAAMVDELRGQIDQERVEAAREQARGFLAPRIIEEADALKGYSLWAETYDEDDNPVTAVEDAHLPRLIGDVAGLRVLDVGCGTGRWALRLARQGAHVTGVDPCEPMLQRAIERAQAEGLQIDLRQGSLDCFPEGSYDLVLCTLVLGHLADLEGAIGEMAARVGEGGRLIITDFHYFGQLLGWRTGCRWRGEKYHIENHLHDYGEYIAAFLRAGLRIAAVEDICWDENASHHGIDGAASPWWGFPLCLVVVGER